MEKGLQEAAGDYLQHWLSKHAGATACVCASTQVAYIRLQLVNLLGCAAVAPCSPALL